MDHGYTVEQIRAAEARALRHSSAQAFVVAGPDALMQRAAAGLATAILRRLRRGGRAYGARVLLVVGSGNNGGDALFAGVRLAHRGVAVTAWRTGDRVHQAGWRAFGSAGGREVGAQEAMAGLGHQRLVVDGVAGIGSRPGLGPMVAAFAKACVMSGVPVVAVDLPSGLAPEPPLAEAPHFSAALTVSFGGLKLCQLLEPARSACGEIELVEIGLDLPEPMISRWGPTEVAAAWPVPDASSDKYSRGVVGIDTGSSEYPGAGVLGCLGAVHAGAGMARYTGPASVADLVHARLPNVVTAPGRVQAWVLGSGWGQRPDAARRVAAALETRLPVVLDADGISHLPPGGGRREVLLTPHAGELADLLGVGRAEVEADPITALRRAVALTGCTVLLKGASQYVAAPGETRIWLPVPGPGWTAQAGSGDVLAGICGTLLAAGLSPVTAALAAASVQAIAATAVPGPWPPQDLVETLSGTIQELSQNW